MFSTANSFSIWTCQVHTCVSNIHIPHSSWRIEKCCIPSFLSLLLTGNYATGSDFWIELLQVSTSILILCIFLYCHISASINQNSRSDSYNSEGEPCTEFLWGFGQSHSVCHRGTALADPVTSVSATVSLFAMLSWGPQNHRTSSVFPTWHQRHWTPAWTCWVAAPSAALNHWQRSEKRDSDNYLSKYTYLYIPNVKSDRFLYKFSSKMQYQFNSMQFDQVT